MARWKRTWVVRCIQKDKRDKRLNDQVVIPTGWSTVVVILHLTRLGLDKHKQTRLVHYCGQSHRHLRSSGARKMLGNSLERLGPWTGDQVPGLEESPNPRNALEVRG